MTDNRSADEISRAMADATEVVTDGKPLPEPSTRAGVEARVRALIGPDTAAWIMKAVDAYAFAVADASMTEAADTEAEVRGLSARVAELEAALREIAEGVPFQHKGSCYFPCHCNADALIAVARRALEPAKAGT